MTDAIERIVAGEILEEQVELTLVELCRACGLSAEQVFDLVEQGVIEPLGTPPAGWRFAGSVIRRIRCAQRLQQDLGINAAGVALALDLLDELERLRARLARLEA